MARRLARDYTCRYTFPSITMSGEIPMARRRRLLLAALLAGSVLSAACGGSGSQDPLVGGDPVRGEALFANNCAQCHGAQLDGTQTGPPLIHEYYVPSHHSDASFLSAIQRGVMPHHWQFGAMPPVPALSADDASDIVAYVRQQQREAGLIE